MSKKIGCLIGTVLTFFLGEFWLNYKPDAFPIVVLLVLMLSFAFGLIFGRSIKQGTIDRLELEVSSLEIDKHELNEEIERLKAQLNEANGRYETAKAIVAEKASETTTKKKTKSKKSKE